MSNVTSNKTLKHAPVDKWSGLARLFHWGSVVLLVMTWGMIVFYKNSDSSIYMDLHKAFGVSLLFWVLARVIYRLFSKVPPALPMPTWQHVIASLTHIALYVMLFVMPIVGILMTWYGGRSIDMFGLFELPSLFEIDRSRARFFNDMHTDMVWPAILIFTALHIVGALYHQFVLKDNLIARMK